MVYCGSKQRSVTSPYFVSSCSRARGFSCKWLHLGLPRWPSCGESACSEGSRRRCSFNPWSGRSLGGGRGGPLQYSCLANPLDRGALWAAVHGVVKSRTRLKRLSMPAYLGLSPLHHLWRTLARISYALIAIVREIQESYLLIRTIWSTWTLNLNKESTVCRAQSLQPHPTLWEQLVDGFPWGSSVHGISQTRTPEQVPFPPPEDFLTQGSNPYLLHYRWILYLRQSSDNLRWRNNSRYLIPISFPSANKPGARTTK